MSTKFQEMIDLLFSNPKLKTVTQYISPLNVVRVTKSNKHNNRKKRSNTYLVTVGKPNYKSALFVKACVKAGEPFPVRRLQLDYYPLKRKKK